MAKSAEVERKEDDPPEEEDPDDVKDTAETDVDALVMRLIDSLPEASYRLFMDSFFL